MAKKVLGWISFGFMMAVILNYIFIAMMVPQSSGIAMLLILAFCAVFLIAGIVGIILMNRLKILSGIFFILAGIVTAFIGFMCSYGGLFFGIIGMLLGFVALIMFILSAVFCFISKK